MQELSKNLFEELPHHTGEKIWMKVVMILMVIGGHMKIKGPLNEEDTKVRMGGHWIGETIGIEDILGEGIQVKMGDPLEEGRPPDGNGGPPDDGGPPGDGQHPRYPGE